MICACLITLDDKAEETRGSVQTKEKNHSSHLIVDVICSIRLLVIDTLVRPAPTETSWPSGLRRHVKAVVFTGACSNHAEVIFLLSEV
jgi:hypothetical protein